MVPSRRPSALTSNGDRSASLGPGVKLTRLVVLISFLSLSPASAQQQPADGGTIGQVVPAQPRAPVTTTQQQPQQPAKNANSIKPLLQAAMAIQQQQQRQQQPKALAAPVSVTPTQTNVQQQQQPQQQPQTAADFQNRRPVLLQQGHINREEPIVQLDYSSIHDEVLNKRTANFVYFNANFNQCWNCNRFFNVWKDLALDIRWWRNLIKLFTINCSDDDNMEVCRRAGVTQLPQLKFYWFQSDSLNRDGQRMRILGKSVHAMRHLILDKVFDSYLEHNKLLRQRSQQGRNLPAAGNPFAALTPLIGSTGSTSGANPLASLVPMIMPMLTGGAGGNSSSVLGASGGLASVLGLLMGAKQQQQPGGSGNSSALSLSSLTNSFGGTQGISQLLSALASVASWRRSLTLQPLPSNWPELEPIEVADTQRLLDILPLDPAKEAGALLIMETQEFLHTGLEVMLDLNPYSNQTYIARVRDERSHLSKNLTRRDDIQAPALIYVTGQREVKLIMEAPKYTNDEDLRRAFVRSFERRQIKYPVKRVWSSTFSQRSNGQVRLTDEDEDTLSRMNKVYMDDLLNTIRASLMEQVFRHPDLSDDQYNALVKYVYALINYFPFKSDDNLKFFKRLHTWLQNQVSPMDVSEYKKQFHDVDEVLGKKREWLACKSLSNVNSVPSSRKRSGLLFENPAQLGKVVSNITRLFRANQQKVGQLKTLIGGIFSSGGGGGSSSWDSSFPVMLPNPKQLRDPPMGKRPIASSSSYTSTSETQAPATTSASSPSALSSSSESSSKDETTHKKEESSLEKLIKSLSSGSLGSDSSILKLISTALTGGGGSDDSANPKAGKSKFAREYPCGAWKLAHVMVANEYLKDSPRKDVKHIVLHSLYQYMVHFYACPTCGNRVSDVSGEFRLNLEDHLIDQSDSIMLLWKMHNRVNKRLESEPRPGSPAKRQFPSESLCPKCRAPKVKTGESQMTSDWPNWQDRQVLNFMVHHYRPQNIITNGDGSKDEKSSATSHAGLEGATWTIWLATTVFISHLIGANFLPPPPNN